MRFNRLMLACTTLIGGLSLSTASIVPAFAAPKASPTSTAPAPVKADPNMVIATVDGQKITLSDVQGALSELPPAAMSVPREQLIPLLLGQLISQKAIEIAAKKEKLENNPEIKTAMMRASEAALMNGYIKQKVAPKITENAMKAYYDKHYANKKPEQEVHARHILVDSEAKAKDIIAQLKKGGDFAKLAAKNSSDKATASNNGGDLGWFKRGDMIPDFSKAAFDTKSGTYTQKPVHTVYGWHVIQVLGTRTAPVPTYDKVKNQIRQNLLKEEIGKVVEAAEKSVKIVRYDAQGKPIADAPAPTKAH
ncbi:peptidylprolyl isomerase [Aristophania vespae]|uniref:Parvulin-like PPIase n=1 Tax=Aristophania vespae TaxID=2697033 RepID=A0A6P1NEC8_9PROT|nr:peptidylprolyl isomerase [Aristophania vespae]QHI95237.1 peptidylprolyl isomerase [Aristophania vespae]UMM64482.1 Putative peptidyl-prolyl cis-trans isomerase [Aristophania vespae]